MCKLPSKKETRISYKLRDFVSVFLVALRERKKTDLFIGLESINALAGIILRKFGQVKTVVYYVSDYSPARYKNKAFNAIYVWLDRFCVTHADFTWDVSLAMQKGRHESGLPKNRKYKVIHVPNGLYPSQIKSLPVHKRKKYNLVYMGILRPDMGSGLAIKAFARVIRVYPKARLHVIGGSQKDMSTYKALARRLHLEKSIQFYGFVHDNNEMAQIIRNCYIGLAPYRAFSDSIRWYADAGKIRQYTASGLPVVTTHVPPLGQYIVQKGAGIMTTDTAKSFSDGIMRLLSDTKLYKSLSEGAKKVSKNNTWENVYTKTLQTMQKL